MLISTEVMDWNRRSVGFSRSDGLESSKGWFRQKRWIGSVTCKWLSNQIKDLCFMFLFDN